jgi:hypothetical protein
MCGCLRAEQRPHPGLPAAAKVSCWQVEGFTLSCGIDGRFACVGAQGPSDTPFLDFRLQQMCDADILTRYDLRYGRQHVHAGVV